LGFQQERGKKEYVDEDNERIILIKEELERKKKRNSQNEISLKGIWKKK
jgi:hypothetical protein